MAPDDDFAQVWADAMEAESEAPPAQAATINVEPTSLLATDSAGGDENLDLLLDVPVTVSVEIGRTSLSIKEVLELAPGSIISLGKLAGEPMDLLVNGKKIAEGEIVIVDESFGIRDSFGIRVTNILADL